METDKKKGGMPKTQIIRHIIQLLAFLVFPGLFIVTLSSIEVILEAFLKWSFSLTDLAVPLVTLIAVIPVTALWGRFFCGYLCAFGSMQELAGFIAEKVGIKQITISPGRDALLKKLKYAVLAVLVVLWVLDVSYSGLSPWNVFGIYTSISGWSDLSALVSVGGLLLAMMIIGSLFVTRFFCRYLCPLGGIFTVISKPRLFRIKKADGCTDCGLCTKQCPMGIAVEAETSESGAVQSGECIDCFRCVDCCSFDALRTDPKAAAAGTLAAATISGLYYAGNIAAGTETFKKVASGEIKLFSGQPQGKYKDGTYQGTGRGFRDRPTTVEVVVKSGMIKSVTVLEYEDDDSFFRRAEAPVIESIITEQSAEVEAVSGATYSSRGIMEAVANALDIPFNGEADA